MLAQDSWAQRISIEEVILLPDSNVNRDILLIDPDEAFGQALQQVLAAGYRLRQVSTLESAISVLGRHDVDVVLLNHDQQSGNPSFEDALGLASLTSGRDFSPPVIAYGWDTRRQKAIEAFQHGAVDFLEQPLDVQALKF